MTRIALDAMGGDGAPAAPLEAALTALREEPAGLEVLAVGRAGELRRELEGREPPGGRLEVVPAPQVIGMDEPPALALRRKPDSSISVALTLVRDGHADAVVSAGSTGALMAGSVLHLGLLPGVDRPAVAALFPTSRRPTLVLDVGANVASRPSHLHQFAHLGAIYARELLGRARPRIGLLNVGEEPEKGDELAVASHRRLARDPDLHFVGNVEGHRIIEGVCDVLVCDGFAGNVLLKFYESIAGFVVGMLEDGREPDPALTRLRTLLDYTEYGGAPLLGVDGVAIVCHGASPPRAIVSALRVARASVESEMVGELSRDLQDLARRTTAEAAERVEALDGEEGAEDGV